jgi:hypothetical protein
VESPKYVRTKSWWLTWNNVRPCLVRLNRLLLSPKQQRWAKPQSKTKETSKCEKEKCFIHCVSLGAYTLALFIQLDSYLLQLYKLTPIFLQLDLWLTWTLSHDLYLFELLTWSYSDSNSTWSPPQLSFQWNPALTLPYSNSRSWSPFRLRLHFNSDLFPQSSSWVHPNNLPG